VRAELREWLRRLHDETHVTTLFVTHDQEEAMDVAEQIVVINEGRIEQAGTPAEIYEQPANLFVMSFIGPVSEIGGGYVRPHDVEISLDRTTGSVEGMVERVVNLGFEVRVHLVLAGGRPLTAQLTRLQASELELEPGQILHVRTRQVPDFAAA
jgi:sulfate transport system ATP-binding protein